MKKTETDQSQFLPDENIFRHLGEALTPVELSKHKKEAMRMRILDRIDNAPAAQIDLLLTIRQDEGNWIEIAPKIKKKQLFIDFEKGTESYLLKVEPGAEAPAHDHYHDEFCLVLEGSVDFEDIHLNTGDYHVARKGSFHGIATSDTGALLYLQSALTEHSIV